MIRRPPRSTLSSSSAASDVYKRQVLAAPPIRRPAAHGGEDQGERRRRAISLPLPGFDHCLLDEVLRIRLAAALLAGKEEQSGSVVKHPPLPIHLFCHLIC